ncbi:MAG: phosphodiesterase [Burkholderiales bacterium]|nr:phosphodiesterase [Burkholderiales bacterium]MDE2456497.1 phosphodiesterase [Burkholderiales bacterium]
MNHSLVQLSDPHIKAPGEIAYGRVDTAAYLREAVAAVGRLRQPPRAVVVTGDLADFGRAAEYEQLRSLLEPLACTVYLMPGNHDDREALRQAFPEHAYLQGGGHWIQYAVDLGGARLVAADTVVSGQPHGELCAERLQQIDELLAREPRTPTLLALHHPPFETLIGHMDEIGLRGAEALAEVVRRHPQVERVICGHLHRSIQARWAGTIALTAPSTAHQVALDLTPDADSAFMMEPPGFLVHAWGGGAPLVSHLMPVGSFDGPYPFHDENGLID